MEQLRILTDENIPCVEQAFGRFGRIRALSGRSIGPSAVQDVDVLLVRSVTPVGPRLLHESSVRFVGSATIGREHVDEGYLRSRGIPFVHAPGANADSVADYVLVALLELARRQNVSLSSRSAGIVGCGNIGSRVARRLSALGVRVLRHDPPKVERTTSEERAHDYVSLAEVVDQADIISLHVPLKTEGTHATHHLVDGEFLDRLGEGTWLINTSRGAVVDGDALRAALREGAVDAAVLDVWENEPSPNPDLIEAVDVATPHIAGYAYDGKVRGTAMLYRGFCEHFGFEPRWEGTAAIRLESRGELRCQGPDPRLSMSDWLSALGRQAYDLLTDDASMRTLIEVAADERGEVFTRLRGSYRRRRELQQHIVSRSAVPPAYVPAAEKALTIQVAEGLSTRDGYD